MRGSAMHLKQRERGEGRGTCSEQQFRAWRRPTRRGRGWLAALALAALALALVPASAGAAPARYVYEMCDSALPGGGVAGVVHSQSGTQSWGLIDNRNDASGSLAVRQTGSILEYGGSATWGVPIKRPPGGSMESLAISGEICHSQGTVGWILRRGWPPPACGA